MEGPCVYCGWAAMQAERLFVPMVDIPAVAVADGTEYLVCVTLTRQGWEAAPGMQEVMRRAAVEAVRHKASEESGVPFDEVEATVLEPLFYDQDMTPDNEDE